MMKNLNYIILVFLSFLFSCHKEHAPDCFTANGADVSEIRDIGAFRSIELNDNIDLNLFKGTEYKVEVICGEYIIDKIATSVQSGTLIIDNNNKCNFVRGYKRRIRLNVTVPTINRVINNGVGTIIFDMNYQQDSIINTGAGSSGDIYVNGTFGEVYSNSHGNGDSYFNGTADRFVVYSNGTNYTHAENLIVKHDIFVATYSLGDTYLNLNSNNTLDYYIWKDGNIYYSGTPAAIHEMSDGTAKGKLIQQ